MYDAIVLAGGAAHRLGGVDKAVVPIGPSTLLDRVLAAVAGAERVIAVGPRRRDPAASVPVTWCREDPAGGGPVAAISAGLVHTSADTVVVLAVDLPWIARAVPELVAALTSGPVDVAVLVDADGRPNYLAAAWRRAALAAALRRIGETAGVPARRMLDGVDVAKVADAAGWGQDCDTWDDVATARQQCQDGRI